MLTFCECFHRITKPQNHRICWVEGDQKDQQVQILALHSTISKSHIMYKRALSKHFLNFKLGAVTTSLRSLFQCPAMLWVENLFLISNLNWHNWHKFKPFPWVLSVVTREEISAWPLCLPLWASCNCSEISLQSPPIQAEQTKWPHPLLIQLQTLHHPHNSEENQ